MSTAFVYTPKFTLPPGEDRRKAQELTARERAVVVHSPVLPGRTSRFASRLSPESVRRGEPAPGAIAGPYTDE